MAQMNPDFKYYVQVEGTWENKDKTCKVIISRFQNIEMKYGQCSLSSSYAAKGIPPQMITNQMMGFNSPMMTMGRNYKIHDGEEIKLTVMNPSICADGKAVYSLEEAWYGNGILHLVVMNNTDKSKTEIELSKEKPDFSEQSVREDGIYSCTCGYTGPVGKFCPECGKKIEG
ncbi:hypothetical protein UYO_2133 [Lachnospiraceae bacterium JC7]|nr:hypothetical protein UYO_2133 [Lachnospiraceae bacterium JC7]